MVLWPLSVSLRPQSPLPSLATPSPSSSRSSVRPASSGRITSKNETTLPDLTTKMYAPASSRSKPTEGANSDPCPNAPARRPHRLFRHGPDRQFCPRSINGHDGWDVHPLVRELGVCVHKQGLKEATFYEDVRNRKGVNPIFSVSGIPETDWRYDDKEPTT